MVGGATASQNNGHKWDFDHARVQITVMNLHHVVKNENRKRASKVERSVIDEDQQWDWIIRSFAGNSAYVRKGSQVCNNLNKITQGSSKI